jgi:hypothetical protein
MESGFTPISRTEPLMHRLPSRTTVLRFRISAIFLWLAVLAFPGGVALLVLGMIYAVKADVVAGALVVAAGVLLYIVVWIVSARARCPLCMTPPLHPKRCQKNHRAGRLFGSYRLKVATSVIFLNHFQCPYCGEESKVTARSRPSFPEG